jgi:hypothetical protein
MRACRRSDGISQGYELIMWGERCAVGDESSGKPRNLLWCAMLATEAVAAESLRQALFS